jgi:hypothetical protein
MNESLRQGLIIAAVLIVLIGIGALLSRVPTRKLSSQTAATPAIQSITYKGEEGKTVLELLERDHTVEKQDTPYGTYVRSIDGLGQTDNSVWLPYVDGENLAESVDKAKTTPNQTISWRYETF